MTAFFTRKLHPTDNAGGDPAPNKQAVLGIDVGGTKIAYALYEVIGGKITDKMIGESQKQDTQRGVEKHPAQIARIVAQARQQANAAGYKLVGIGIGSPGKFVPDSVEPDVMIIDPKSNSNMEEIPGEFDRQNLSQLYRNALDAQDATRGIPVAVTNDALAAQTSLLEDMLAQPGSKAQILDKVVGYIGPGTGLGGGFAHVTSDGTLSTTITDGHLSDLLLDARDPALKLDELGFSLDKLKGVNKITFEGDKVRAEDLISGDGVARLIGKEKGSEVNADIPEHRNALKLMGRAMAAMIRDIRDEKVEKQSEARQWTDGEKAVAAQTSVYFYAGGFGLSKEGQVALDETKKALGEMGINDIGFISVNAKAATRAAASMMGEMLRSQGAKVQV